MAIQSLLLLLGLTAAGNEQVIDAFEYADSEAARQAWVASSGTPAVEMVREDGRAVLQFQALFASDQKMPRTIIDRRVKLDLAVPGQFTLQMAAERPESVGRVSLYFRSGDGWYSAGAGLRAAGWNTLTFSKAAFGIEGKPAGWHQIDGIRVSVWRGQATDSAIRLGHLAAQWHDVALVIPAAYAHPGDREVDTALKTADSVGRMLAELGLGSDAVEDAALVHGALGKRRVAVLAYNPHLSPEATAALEDFVRAGGKLFACYTLPSRLGRLLGVSGLKHIRRAHPGQFAEIRFDAAGIPGLPESVRQSSWNVNVPESTDRKTRVIGQWYDEQGRPTGHAAMLLSDAGAFMTHIVLADDRSKKRQMLAAILGRLDPALWEQMARSELDRIGKVGHLDGFEQVAAYVNKSRNAAATAHLETAVAARKTALTLFARQAYPEAVQRARETHDQLVAAYLNAAPSPTREGRAFWNHSGTGAYDGDWERSAKELAAAGFNMVLPNMLWAGRAHYASDVLPRSKTYQEHGDQIAQCVAACKRHGVEVHVWKVNWNLSGAPKDFVEKMRREGRTQVNIAGEPVDWLCPSHPENLRLELESMLEVARKYDVDGLHFDYIRYPNRSGCYCDGCRERFQADTGLTVADWPKDCYSGALHDQYHDWRCEQITRLVAAVHREAKKIRPELKISAAVFGAYPQCRETVGQDWVAWVKAGYLDFICPMDYTESDLSFTNLVTNQLELVGGRIPLYPGIGATASRSALSPDRVVGQIHIARSLGAAGFTIFNFTAGTAERILPGVGLGAGSQRAVPPHRRRSSQ